MAIRTVAALLLVACVAWGLDASLPAGELRDYGSFVASGRAATAGENPYGIHPLTFHVVLPGFDVWNPNLNPPVSLPLFALFDTADPHRGFRWWWITSLLAYGAAVLLLTRRYGGRRSLLLPLWALALAGFWDTLALGQIYLPLVLASAGAWLLLDRGRPTAAGILIGVVVAVKPNFAVWPALLLLAGYVRPAAAAGATVVALSALPVAIYGWTVYRQWVELILSDAGRAAFLTNASLPGLLQRLNAGAAGAVAAVAILAGLATWAVRRRPTVLTASACGLFGGIVASPIAWVHYTLFLLPVFFWMRLSPAAVAAAALLVVPVPLMLRTLDAPLWQQVTLGSVYNWAVLLLGVALTAAARSPVREPTPALTVVFYDGVCGLCDRFVHFLLSHDRRGLLRFAPLQGALARRDLERAGHDPAALRSILVVADKGSGNERVLARSRAVLHVLATLGGAWALVARVGALVPTALADRLYDLVAAHRYRWFGQFETCPLPKPEWRSRFIDDVVTDV
ncbi:MAG TPA: glycosyltransferase 87 family protein [Vicinamibacterales bacterium]|nr:glycosyltransferase 87 family protein [Vicinamibacterales bacterium]